MPLPLKSSTHTETPRKLKNVSGTMYFQDMRINWSTRRRGSVQRIQMTVQTRASALAMKTPSESRFAHTGGSDAALKKGICQPPRKQAVASEQTTKMSAYSAMKKKPNRMPEYSVL